MSYYLWDIPKAAWKRKLGDYPKGATGTHPPLEVDKEISIRTKRGIPIGGIGTGSFMYNLAGSFGPWEFGWGDDSSDAQWGSEASAGHEERFLRAGAFHIYQESNVEKFVKTLATEDIFESWPKLEVGQGTYYALFPKAWVNYDIGLNPFSLKLFSPFIPRNDKLSSLPIGFFQFKLKNRLSEPCKFSLMFTFPNAIYREDTKDYTYTRKGLSTQFVTKQDISALRLQSKHPDNVPVTQQTEWVIGVKSPKKATVTYTDWALQDADKLFETFSARGLLPNTELSEKEGEAGALAVTIDLNPKEEIVVPFALVWDFPIVQFKNPIDGTQWWKRYKEWYPGFFRGIDILLDGLQSIDEWETQVDKWMNLIVDNPKYPDWLKQGALNELYFDTFCSFWESGCISKPKRFGNRPNQHLFFNLESVVYRDCETLDIRHYEAIHKKIMFPNIERDTLLLWKDFIMDDSKNRTTHDAGSPINDPFFIYGQYYMTSSHDLNPPAVNWKDLPSMFVQQVYAYYHYTQDVKFLEEVYPAAKKTLLQLASCDRSGDGLPEHRGIDTSYDSLGFRGTSTYISGLYIGALEAVIAMSHVLGKNKEKKFFKELNQKARSRVQELLWVETGEGGGYYRAAEKRQFSDALMTDALNGQRYVDVCHLPDVFPLNHRVSHYERVCKYNWKMQADGKFGTVNIVRPNGDTIPINMARGIWPGGVYFTVATMYRTGKKAKRPDIMENALEIAHCIYNTTFLDEEMAFWFNTPAIWWPEPYSKFRSQQNMRIRAIWELVFELDDPFSKIQNEKKR
ncbi:MAG: hypothetical protein JW776_05705 [Candidatus Lokiarchaeota archaeon]|nr:hypothetical protein [Candidatus Lokiarchaeota archaeon]